MADEGSTAEFDRSHEDRVLRDSEWVFDERTYDVRLVLCGALPPPEHITTADCIAFDCDRILLALHVSRGWTIPGGHLEAGESAEDAMRREALEEAGIVVGVAEVLAYERIQIRGEPPADFKYPNPGYQVFFVAPLVAMGPIAALDECTEARLFTPDEARVLDGWMDHNLDLYDAALQLATRSAPLD